MVSLELSDCLFSLYMVMLSNRIKILLCFTGNFLARFILDSAVVLQFDLHATGIAKNGTSLNYFGVHAAVLLEYTW